MNPKSSYPRNLLQLFDEIQILFPVPGFMGPLYNPGDGSSLWWFVVMIVNTIFHETPLFAAQAVSPHTQAGLSGIRLQLIQNNPA